MELQRWSKRCWKSKRVKLIQDEWSDSLHCWGRSSRTGNLVLREGVGFVQRQGVTGPRPAKGSGLSGNGVWQPTRDRVAVSAKVTEAVAPRQLTIEFGWQGASPIGKANRSEVIWCVWGGSQRADAVGQQGHGPRQQFCFGQERHGPMFIAADQMLIFPFDSNRSSRV